MKRSLPTTTSPPKKSTPREKSDQIGGGNKSPKDKEINKIGSSQALIPKQFASRKNKCNYGPCKQKLRLTSTPCKCKLLFCDTHKYSNSHNCAFDYKTAGEQHIKKNNPTTVPLKIIKF